MSLYINKQKCAGNVGFDDIQKIFDDYGREKITDVCITNINRPTSPIPDDIFSGMFNVEHLRFGNNYLYDKLDENIFTPLVNMTKLELNNCSIGHLPEKIFASQVNLKSLDLHSNALMDLPENIFANLTNLNHLYLNHNSLTDSLPTGIFKPLTQLKTLYLFNNSLTFESGDFDTLVNLEYLDISENRCGAIRSPLFSNNLNSLIHLNIKNTPLKFKTSRPTDQFIVISS